MALFQDSGFEAACTLLEKTRVPDGAGGYITGWTDGVEFTVYKYMSSTNEVRIAEQKGFTSVYSGFVDKDFPLNRGDVFRDNETKITYRVTSDPNDNKAPEMSTLDYKEFSAERWALTT